jgi:hypothetical protein
MIPSQVHTHVTLIEPHDERTWHAKLPNGKAVIAFRFQHESKLVLKPGERVPASLSVCDFSQAHLEETCFDNDAKESTSTL